MPTSLLLKTEFEALEVKKQTFVQILKKKINMKLKLKKKRRIVEFKVQHCWKKNDQQVHLSK